jgi:hypothetical protein
MPVKDRRKGVSGGPRVLQGISVIRVRASSVESCPTMALNLQCRERARVPYGLTATRWRGRSGLRWDVREDSLRPSALSKARLDARGHSGTESREPPTYQRIKAADRVDKATSNQICSSVVMASSKGLSSINNIGGRCLRSILRISGQFGGQPGGFVGRWLYVHRRR